MFIQNGSNTKKTQENMAIELMVVKIDFIGFSNHHIQKMRIAESTRIFESKISIDFSQFDMRFFFFFFFH